MEISEADRAVEQVRLELVTRKLMIMIVGLIALVSWIFYKTMMGQG